MLAGIISQLGEDIHCFLSSLSLLTLATVFIMIFSGFAIEFVYRYFKNKPVRKETDAQRGFCDSKLQLMLFGLFISTSCLLVR